MSTTIACELRLTGCAGRVSHPAVGLRSSQRRCDERQQPNARTRQQPLADLLSYLAEMITSSFEVVSDKLNSFMGARNNEKQFVTLRDPSRNFLVLRNEVVSRDTHQPGVLARHAAKPAPPSHPLLGPVC